MDNTVIAWPVQKKRGPKVRNGPSAQVVGWPLLCGDELASRWAWLRDNSRKWNVEDCDGRYDDPRDWRSHVAVRRGLAQHYNELFNESTMRNEVAAGRAEIRKRIALKDWLESKGIDWDVCKTPEDALIWLFELSRA